MMSASAVVLNALHLLGGTGTLGGIITVARLEEPETTDALRQLRDAGLVALRSGRYEICDPCGKIMLAEQAHWTAKTAEEMARNARLAAEEQALRLVGVKAEPVARNTTDWFRVSTTSKLGRTLVPALLAAIQSQAPQDLYEHAIRCKLELSLTGLENGNPEIFARAIVIKPAIKKERV